MPKAFNFQASPFDCLRPQEQQLVRDTVDVAYFREGDSLLEPGTAPSHLFVVIKGQVTQYDGEQPVASYGPDDCFDGRALVAGRSANRFMAREEVLAYALPRDAVNELVASNTTFGALLFADFSAKLGALAQRRSGHELQALNMARVADAFVRPVQQVDAATDIVSVARLLQARHVSSVLVRDPAVEPARLGIFTQASLQRAILDGTPLAQLAVGGFANYELATIGSDAPIGDALALMLRRRVHRLVVLGPAGVAGVLEALDVFSFLANHSQLITVQIEMAQDLPALAEAAARITRMVSLLWRGGTRVGLIAELVTELNTRLFERAWELIAPDDVLRNTCLFVMGSEGRGEQLLKTDQDNALVLRDGWSPPADLAQLAARFSKALAEFGYPPCPGGIMLERPEWRMPASEFAQTLRGWLHAPTPEHLMNLAVFLDARPVCGDAQLLRELRAALMRQTLDDDAMLGRFASAIDAFGSSPGWWNRWLGLGHAEQTVDLKKEAMFPLVHGVRSLALAHRIDATGTRDRVEALVAAGALDRAEGDELVQALHLLMEIRLQAGLDELDARRPVSGQVDLRRIGSLERNLLHDALGVVKRFKATLHRRFQLDRL